MDFLAFALDLVAAEMNIPRENFQPLERKLRLERGGDRHYIASAVAMEVQERHAADIEALKIAEIEEADAARDQGKIVTFPFPGTEHRFTNWPKA